MAHPPFKLATGCARFGPFRLVASERALFEGERPVRLGSRALGILIALIERAGENVGRDELIAAVWPDTVVVDSNLNVNVAALRKALGDGQAGRRFIISVPGRGYCFVAPVSFDETATPLPPAASNNNLPARRTALIGRENFVRDVVQRLGTRRLLTVTGPPGVGKTSATLAAAELLLPHYRDGVWWLELAPASDGPGVDAALRAVLGLETRGNEDRAALTALLRDKEMLLVLDNCEHVVDEVAERVDSIIGGAGAVRILATSREPLRVEGEQIFLLPPLRLPPARARLAARDAIEYPAVRLFVERAKEAERQLGVDDSNADTIVGICRKLDGLPLAIELVAAQAGIFGVSDLYERLNDRLLPFASGRRAGPLRHQALSAALDWSYELLSEDEKSAFRAFGIFAGPFAIESAAHVTGLSPPSVSKLVSNLVMKSLVQSERDGHFRLLEATREFLLEKLENEGCHDLVAKRHADYYRGYFEQAYDDFVSKPRARWHVEHHSKLDNLRSALDWCFSERGDASTGIALTINAVPFWLHMSLGDECRRRVRQALSCPEDMRSERQDMRLRSALSGVLLEWGDPHNDLESLLEKTSALARKLRDTDYHLRALSMLWYFRLEHGDFIGARSTAEEFSSVAQSSPDTDDLLVGDRMMAATLYILGNHAEASYFNERVIGHHTAASRRSDVERFTLDQMAQALSLQSSILWTRGFPDQSANTIRAVLREVVDDGHAGSICSVLVHSACPLALFRRDYEEAEICAALLTDFSGKIGADLWRHWGSCYAAILQFQRHRTNAAVNAIGINLKNLSPWWGHPRNKILVSEYAQACAWSGRASEGLAILNATIEQCERARESVLLAELLRVKAEISVLAGASRQGEARRTLARAVALAKKQGALSLELRAALSLVRLQGKEDRQAVGLLQSAYDKFVEGWETADLIETRQVLASS